MKTPSILYRTFALPALLGLLLTTQPSAASDATQDLLPGVEMPVALDPSLYWVSEKLDGVRARWDGSALYFRSGRKVTAPRWFTALLPSGQELDGELWIGHGMFSKISGTVNKHQPIDKEWRKINYMLFELPNGRGSFTRRIARLKEIVATINAPWVQMIEQTRVPDMQALGKRLQEVLDKGGEGLMLHLASSAYHAGRSDALIKIKPWQDMEGVVIEHLPGKGRLKGMMGSLLVQLADGRKLKIGTGFTDEERRNPPPVGATVTFRYKGLTSTGLPRHASYWRIRQTP